MTDDKQPLSGAPLSKSGILIGRCCNTAAFRILDASVAFCAASGWTIEELLDADPQLLWGPDYRSVGPLKDSDAGGVWSGTLATAYRDGSAVTGTWQIAALATASDDQKMLLCVQQEPGGDIRARNESMLPCNCTETAGSALPQSNVLLAEILRVAADAIVVTDQAGRIVEFNRGAEEMFGYARTNIVGCALDRLIPPEYRAAHAHAIRRFGAGDTPARLMNERSDIVGLRRDGSTFPCQASIARVNDGNTVLYAAILRDLTQTKRIESELRAALDRAEQGGIAKARFLATVSHELHTPLNAIIGFSDILRSEQFGPIGNPKYLEYAADIFASGLHLFALISDVMEFSLIESGEQAMKPSTFALVGLVDEIASQFEAKAQKNGQTLVVDVPVTLLIRADRTLLRQMIVNLVDNALKFSDRPDSIDVAAWLEPSGSLAIAVADRGVGIPESALHRVTEPFFQVDDSDTRHQQGIGIGLSLVERIAALHGGTLRLTSNPDRGITATVKLPASLVV